MIALLLAAAVAVPMVPNRQLTPGDVLTTDAAKVCVRGYARTVRHVSEATKREVFRRYGITCTACGKKYEVDHLISLELGGSNDIKNLWPEPYAPEPGAHTKDLVENYLHQETCLGHITLAQAQHDIATDWPSAWKRMPKKGPAYRRAARSR